MLCRTAVSQLIECFGSTVPSSSLLTLSTLDTAARIHRLKFNELARIAFGMFLAPTEGQGQTDVNLLSPTFCYRASDCWCAFGNDAWPECPRQGTEARKASRNGY